MADYVDDCADLAPPMSYEDAVRYGRGVGIDTDRLDLLESSQEFAVTLPGGCLATLSFAVTVTRGGNWVGILPMPTLRGIADAALAIKGRAALSVRDAASEENE